MPAKKIWTKEEDLFISENYTRKTYAELGSLLNASSRSIITRIRELDLPRQKAPRATVNKSFFSSINDQAAYWAGFIAADGCLYERYQQLSFELQLRDYTHLLKFAAATDYTGRVKIVERKDKGWSAQMYIAGVSEWFEDLGNIYNIVPRKSLTLKPPATLVTDTHALSFIKGYIDGDGCIGCYKATHANRWDWIVRVDGTYGMLEYIKNCFDILVPSLGKPARINQWKGSNIFLYVVRGKRAEGLLKVLSSVPTPCLERKWNKFIEESLTNAKKI